ncbi:hypothetical protein K469DRAFT_602931, partial [Zopfia rhizophila CBS 207.26]
GSNERITAVTLFRPRSVFLNHKTILTIVHPISNLNRLYTEYVEYRFGMAMQLIEHIRGTLRTDTVL